MSSTNHGFSPAMMAYIAGLAGLLEAAVSAA
jgi:hypothetical protein